MVDTEPLIEPPPEVLPEAPPEGRWQVPDIIAQIKDTYSSLRPAEQAVADAVLGDVRTAVEASNAEIALRAGVSQPSVTRFCRAIGCDGVRDFKLKLARSLVVGELYLASGVTEAAQQSDPPPFCGPVQNEARRALRAVEAQLEPARVLEAAGHIAAANQVAVFGLGGSSSALAEETQHRLFRYGVAITANKDPYLIRMTDSTLKPGDVVITISASGRTRELIEAVELARHYRARTIAITAQGSDLAVAVDVALTVRIAEYPDALKPSAIHYAFLAIVELMSVATGYALGPDARENLRRIKYNVLTHRPSQRLEPLGD